MNRLMRAMNGIPAMLPRSPLPGLTSGSTLIITSVGRKRGNKNTIQVVYLHDRDKAAMTIDSPWWKNLRGKAPVALPIYCPRVSPG